MRYTVNVERGLFDPGSPSQIMKCSICSSDLQIGDQALRLDQPAPHPALYVHLRCYTCSVCGRKPELGEQISRMPSGSLVCDNCHGDRVTPAPRVVTWDTAIAEIQKELDRQAKGFDEPISINQEEFAFRLASYKETRFKAELWVDVLQAKKESLQDSISAINRALERRMHCE